MLPQTIGAEVRRELGRFGPEGGLGEVVVAWPAAVGPAIAANAWPARVGRDGTLHVSTRSSAWAFELTQLAATVLERLREHLGEQSPLRLRFAVGPLPEGGRPPETSQRRIVPKPNAVQKVEAERLAAAIEAEALREAVTRAAAASLAASESQPDGRPVW